MECKTCKEKSNKRKLPGEENLEINLIPKSIQEGDYNGNFFFKIIAFVVVAIAIPFIILVLLGQIFMTFFLPKSLPKVSKKFKAVFMGIFTKYAEFKIKRETKKRENQFRDTTSYVEENIDDIEIFENKK